MLWPMEMFLRVKISPSAVSNVLRRNSSSCMGILS